MASSRAERPAPLCIGDSKSPTTGSSPTSASESTPKSAFSDRWASPRFFSTHGRKESSTSTDSSASSASYPGSGTGADQPSPSRPKIVKKGSSPTVNHYTHCGRHSDQFLFSGWSDLFSKKNGEER